MARYQKALFIFRRDLRLFDNTGLNAALAQSERVIPAFVFDPRQIEPHPYQSQPALQFMLQALDDLQEQIAEQAGTLYCFHDRPENVINRLQIAESIEAVFVNRDYTPFSLQRDAQLQQRCRQLELDFYSANDLLLTEPEQVCKDNQEPYRIFTPFYKRARQFPVALPRALSPGRLANSTAIAHDTDWTHTLKKPHHNAQRGGRQAALALLDNMDQHRDYAGRRDFPALAATTGLSAYLKFGCCSVREAYYGIMETLGEEHPLLRQLYWRDFFTHIAFHFPHVFGQAFHRQYDALPWRNNPDDFQAWTCGRTGFPIIDAGMRQLNATGWMHTRVRMLTASFLAKDLLVDWRWGERYFARHLLDYDPSINNGNWQWAASTGCDAQPYFRLFNPWLQQRKFDADCLYIKQWLPELRPFPAAVIHDWHRQPQPGDYPAPIIDHTLRSRQTKALFQSLQEPGA